jgi:nucleoside-diphosphate-sugar epimerase
MRVLVTGVSGFIGGYIARHLAASGQFDVHGLCRRNSPAMPDLEHLGIRIHIAYLPAPPVDAVVHCAAAGPWCDPVELIRSNIDLTLGLIGDAIAWGARYFIFTSSVSVYGKVADPVLDEATPIHHPDAYGATKRSCEIALALRSAQLPSIALRLPGVIGPGAHARNWLPRTAADLLRGDVALASNLDAPFNNAVHVHDLSRFVEYLLLREWNGFNVATLAARGKITVRGAIERLACGLGIRARIADAGSDKTSFTISSRHAIKWGYDPMEIGAMIDRYAAEVLAERNANAA